jgi:hypothetical protein
MKVEFGKYWLSALIVMGVKLGLSYEGKNID